MVCTWTTRGGSIFNWARGASISRREAVLLINVGSVGPPRDYNPDACYVLYDPKKRSVEFRVSPTTTPKRAPKILKAKLPEIHRPSVDGRTLIGLVLGMSSSYAPLRQGIEPISPL